MTVSATQSPNRYLERPAPSSLADVVEIILDKGLVIDIYIRVSLVGIDLKDDGTSGLPELMGDITEKGAKGKTSGALEGVGEKVSSLLGSGDDEDEDDEDDDEQKRPPRKRPSSSTRKRTSSSSSRTRKKAES
jgi:hypothetical protein